jgi:hypothetical protein
MAIGGVLPYRQPDMQGFQLLAGVLQDRQRQQQQEDFYKRMQALESDFSKRPEDYDTDILRVEGEIKNVEAGASEDPVAAAERMKALSGQRQNLLQQKQARARRGGTVEYSMKARALMNKYGANIDKYDPFKGILDSRQAGRGGSNQTGRRIDFIREMNKIYKEHQYTNKPLAKQALEIRKALYKRSGPMTQDDMNIVSRIISKSEKISESKALKVGKIYPGEGGAHARYGGVDPAGNQIWKPVRKKGKRWVDVE